MAAYGARPRNATTTRPTGDRKLIATARLAPDVYDKLDRAAELLGISLSAMVSELVERLDVDDTGRPGWQSKYRRADEDEQQPLELSA